MSKEEIDSRPFCPECGKKKFQFATERDALQYVTDHAEEIRKESGYVPIRAYYCKTCQCWHTTSKPMDGEISRIDLVGKITNVQRDELTLDNIITEFVDWLKGQLQYRNFRRCLNNYGSWEGKNVSGDVTDTKLMYNYLRNTEPLLWIRMAFDWTSEDFLGSEYSNSERWKALNMTWENIVARSAYAKGKKVKEELRAMSPDDIRSKMKECCHDSQEMDLAMLCKAFPALFSSVCKRNNINPLDYSNKKKSVKVVGKAKLADDPKTHTSVKIEYNESIINTKKEEEMNKISREQIKAAQALMNERKTFFLSIQKDFKGQCDAMKGVIRSWSQGHGKHSDDVELMMLAIDQAHQSIGERLFSMPSDKEQWKMHVDVLNKELSDVFVKLNDSMSELAKKDEAEASAARKKEDERIQAEMKRKADEKAKKDAETAAKKAAEDAAKKKAMEEDMDEELEMLGKNITDVDVNRSDWVHLNSYVTKDGKDAFVVTLSCVLKDAIAKKGYRMAQVAQGKNQGAAYLVFSKTGAFGVKSQDVAYIDDEGLKDLIRILKVQQNHPQNWRIIMQEKTNDIRIKFVERVGNN